MLLEQQRNIEFGAATATHCPYCAFQCGIEISGTGADVRIAGDAAFPVNKGALCIKGWTAAAALSHPDRLTTPLARDPNGVLVPVGWEEALDRIASAFKGTREQYGPDAVGIFGGGSLTNEKSYLLGKFARVALQTANIDYNGRFCMSSAAGASIRSLGLDRGLPFALQDIAGAQAILMMGSNSAETMPPMMQYFEEQKAAGGKLIIADPRHTPTAARADLHFRLIPGTDAALALGLIGKPNSGYGCLTGQGGREHGQKADQLPGYRRIDDPAARQYVASVWGVPETSIPGPGISAYELLDSLGQDGGVRSLMVMGSNVVVSAPNANHVVDRIKALDFLVVSDFFLSETAELADVVLPSAQWAEEEGTMTNLEGRVIRRQLACERPVGVKDDIDVICELASRLGKGAFFAYKNTGEIFTELGRASAGGPADYSGITYEKIDASQGVFWPCPSLTHPGTPRMFTDGFPTATGRASFHAVRHEAPAEQPDADYPLFLTTGRNLAHYQSGTQTRRIPELQEMMPAPLAEIHPSTARRHQLEDGGPVTLQTRRGSANFKTNISRNIREDTIFVPFHWGGMQAANRLTNPALDPISKMPEFKVCAVRIQSTPHPASPTGEAGNRP